MNIEERIVADPQSLIPLMQVIRKLGKAIIVNWERAIIVAVVLYFIGGIWLMIQVLYGLYFIYRSVLVADPTGTEATVTRLRGLYGQEVMRSLLSGKPEVSVEHTRWHRESDLGGVLSRPPFPL